jgi:hypothetical protein
MREKTRKTRQKASKAEEESHFLMLLLFLPFLVCMYIGVLSAYLSIFFLDQDETRLEDVAVQPLAFRVPGASLSFLKPGEFAPAPTRSRQMHFVFVLFL